MTDGDYFEDPDRHALVATTYRTQIPRTQIPKYILSDAVVVQPHVHPIE